MNPRDQHAPPLSVDLLLGAYAAGLFPMAEPGEGPVSWYSPDPRAVLPLDGFRVSRSLRRTVVRGTFRVTVDTAFPEVLARCAAREDTWISGEIARVYTELWRKGYGHSVECRVGEALAGGLYGVALGGAFFGESMFSDRTDASKVALAHLVEILRKGGFALLDVQYLTPHLAGLGAVEITRRRYLALLRSALRKRALFGPPGEG